MIGTIILVIVAIVIFIVLIRTAAFHPKTCEKPLPVKEDVDERLCVERLSAMIRCKTVSSDDPALEDAAEFEKFYALLPALYPKLHKTCTQMRIGRGLIYHWKGRKSGDPAVLMAHFDVVASRDSNWEKPAFEGVVENGVLWGRGTLDTKGTLAGILGAAEALIGEGYTPEYDLYLCFSGDEEIAGPSAPAIVSWFEAQKLHPRFVLDEGGAVVEKVFPGVQESCALIGTAEKGQSSYRFSVENMGAQAHASAPPRHTAIGRLSQACCAVEAHPFPIHLTRPALEMFDTLGRHSSFVFRMLFSNLWLFRPLLDLFARKSGGEFNALLRTTAAFTMMQGSKAPNVMSSDCNMVVNMRLVGGESVKSVGRRLSALSKKYGVKVEQFGSCSEPSVISQTGCEAWQLLARAVGESWPDALISPYLMVAGSDSRHYGRISEHVYRFSAMPLSADERRMIHGDNERIPCKKVADTVRFYIRLIRKL